MRILGYLPGVGRTKGEVLRAARLLNLEYDLAHSERQVIRLAEQWTSLGPPTLVVTTDQEISVVRELLARTPKTSVVLLSSVRLQKLPYFLAVCPSIKCFLFSKTLTSGAEYFIQILNQLREQGPLPFTSLLGAHTRRERFSLQARDQKAEALAWATDFYNWALGDPAEPGVQEKARQLCDTLDELVTNALRHTDPDNPAGSGPSFPITIELGFDGTLLAQRVCDLAGLLERRRVLDTLSTDYRLNERLDPEDTPDGGMGFKMVAERQHRIVFHITPGQCTDITCVSRVAHRFKDHTMIPASIEIYEWPREGSG